MDFPNNNSRPALPRAHVDALFFGALIMVGVVIWLIAWKTGLVDWLFAAVGI